MVDGRRMSKTYVPYGMERDRHDTILDKKSACIVYDHLSN